MATATWTWDAGSMTSKKGSLATYNVAKSITSKLPAGSHITAASLVITVTTNPKSGSTAYACSTTDGSGVAWTTTGSTGARTLNVLSYLSSFNSHFVKSGKNWYANTEMGQCTLLMNWKCGASTTSTQVAWSSIKLTLTYTAGTQPTAPTSFTVSPTSTGKSGSATLSWSGAKAGTGNAITGYLIRYQEFNSAGTQVTSGWTNVATVSTTATSGSRTVNASATNGNYKNFVIYTNGTYWQSGASSPRPKLTTTWSNGSGSISIGASGWTTATGNTNLTISRTNGTNNAFSSYTVQRSTDNSNWSNLATGQTGATYAVAISDTLYYYRAIIYFAQNTVTTGSVWTRHYTNGTGSISITNSGWTTATGNTNLTIGRTAGTNNAFSSYTIQRSTNNSSWSNLAIGQSAATYAVAISDTYYYYRAVIYFAHNTVTTGSVSVGHYVTGPTPTATISATQTTTVNASLTLSWTATAQTNNAISSFTIQYYDTAWANLATGVASDKRSYAVTGPAAGKTRYWRVIAYYAHNSPTSNQVSTIHYTNGTGSISIGTSGWTTATGNTNLTISHANGTNSAFSSYVIQRSTNNSSWSNLATGQTAATYAVAISDTYYYYRAVIYFARNTLTTGSVSVGHYVTGPTPAATISATQTTTASASLTLSWTATAQTNNAISSFTIQYYDTAWANLSTGIASDKRSATVTGPEAGKTRYWRVIAYYTHNSPTSNQVSTIHYTNGTAPTTVTIGASKLTVGNTTTLSWSGAAAGTNNALSKYTVEYSDNNGAWTSYSTSATSPLTVACPAAGVTRRYRVTAVYTRNTANSTAYGTVTGYAAPGAPTSVTIPANCYGSTSYTVSWTGATNADHYNMQYRRTTDGAWGSWANGADKTTTSFTDTWASLPIGQKGQYQIRTVNGAGTASAWTVSNEMTKANTAPTVPGTPSATPTITSNGSISLSWTASTDVDASTGGALSGYSIEYATRADSSASWGGWTELTTVSTNSYTHTWSAAAFNQIKYRVRAYDTIGAYSGYSGESAIVTRQIDNPVIWPVPMLVTYDVQPYFKVQYYVADSTTLQVRSGDLKEDVWGAWTTCTNLTAGINTWIGKLPVDVGAASSSAVQFRIGTGSAIATHQIQYVAPAYARTIAVGSVISDYNTSHIAEINQLVTYVNDMRQLYKLQSITLSDTVGPFINWRKNICQLQNGIDEVYAAIHSDTFTPRSYTTLAQWPTASEINLVRRRIAGDET